MNFCANDNDNFMIISKKTIMGPLPPLLLGDFVLNYVTKTRLLGMTVDDNLTWVPHVMDLKKSFANKLESLLAVIKD